MYTFHRTQHLFETLSNAKDNLVYFLDTNTYVAIAKITVALGSFHVFSQNYVGTK